ncbi:MAG: hypothetical protein HYW57_05015 [Ignavibacteriales bacterium]|nr:hypothetical protein [Ignavibacteriales bacterium]
MQKLPRFTQTLVLAGVTELIAAYLWFSSGPYSSVPSLCGYISWLLHYPGITLLLTVRALAGAPEFVLYGLPPLISLLLWFLFWSAFLAILARKR